MTNFTGNDLRTAFKAHFGLDVGTLTSGQLWTLVKFGKHVRGRCRSNAAFNNYMSNNFSPARFITIEKTDPRTKLTYPGLEIITKEGRTSGDADD